MQLRSRYRLIRSLGEGGSSGVHLVEDRLLGGPPIALKRLGAAADELLRTSFEQEFAVLASLAIPGVARVLDLGLAEPDGEDPGGPYFTRAYVEGNTLDAVCRDVPPTERLRLVLATAGIVAALHRAGVVHGDLKPSNVIVDAQRQPWLIDFGLAHVLGHRAVASGGTLPFLAPELARGGAPSIRSDVYALGATLWTLLRGQLPELGLRVAGRLPAMPADATGVEEAALQLALRAIAPDPSQRTPAVSELVASLGALVPPLPVSRPPFALRPRGTEAIQGRLQAFLRERALGGRPDAIVLVEGPAGSGRTTLLRELKWRVQLGGVRVIEVGVDVGDGLASLVSLVRQAVVLAGTDELARRAGERALDLLEARTRGDDATLQESLVRVLAAVARRGVVALLVDDLDRAEPTVGRVLRAAVYADGLERVALVATAAEVSAAAVRELHPEVSLALAPLALRDVEALARETLRAADASLVEGLAARSELRPGKLVQLLERLADNTAPTRADLDALPEDSEGRAGALARAAAAGAGAQPLLLALAILGAEVPDAVAIAASRVLSPRPAAANRAAESLAACEASGLVARRAAGVVLADRAVARALVDGAQPELVVRLLDADLARSLPPRVLARLALRAQSVERARAIVPEAASDLASLGAARAAAELWSGLAELVDGSEQDRARLEVATLRFAAGEYDASLEAARAVLVAPRAEADQVADAQLTLGRTLTAMGRFDEATEVLARLSSHAPALAQARSARELAKMHLRRGDYAAVSVAAERGLQVAPAGDPVRIELLTSAGMVASYAGKHEQARARYAEALDLARRVGTRRDEANVLTYVAIDHHRAGELGEARKLYAQSLEIARDLGDVGSMATFALNLGAVTFALGEPATAAEHYAASARLARRSGKTSTDVMARTNLAGLHVYLGLYDEARLGAEAALRDANASGLRLVAAQATAILGELRARLGDVDGALRLLDDARARYAELGQGREMAEADLDAAEALLDRDNAADTSGAAARLASARASIDAHDATDLDLRLRWLTARVRGASGDVDAAVAELDQLAREAHERDLRDLEWGALASAGRIHAQQGAEFLARRSDQRAAEILESTATRLPRELRDAFWSDPRRRELRQRAERGGSAPAVAPAPSGPEDAALDPRATRLLEITKRLAGEHDLDRLLERITDAAVELSGAERGFVLLVGPGGALETRTARDGSRDTSDPRVAFSRSIAEAVLIDGEPIVTVDARDDHRLSEFLSVHKLMLRSVACLPIRGRSGTVGVLYLEHRVRRGRFSEAALDVVFVLADQAAIALENARLIAENERRRAELEQANAQLAKAKEDIERLLDARTLELEEARRELGRARSVAGGDEGRYGIVGRSAGMQRVFELVDRVRDASVPVVLLGESGTGKELVARAIHAAGARAKKPFVAVNCAAIPEALLESELFGSVRGAFTGAERDRRGLLSQASGGTLFLDEVADMPAKMQIDLLRVLQDGRIRPVGAEHDEPVDLRVLAACNRPLRQLVAEGRFREDLFYRLDVVEIAIPPLRERPDDLPLLCEHFLSAFARREGRAQKRLAREALQRLLGFAWPGNVRQLEHLLLNAWVLADGDVIRADDLALPDGRKPSTAPPAQQPAAPPVPTEPEALEVAELPANVEEFKVHERKRILAALEATGWNRVRAAKALQMPRRTFYRRLREHEIL